MLPTPETRRLIEGQLAERHGLGAAVDGGFDWLPASGGLSDAGVWRVGGRFAVRRWPPAAGDAARLGWAAGVLRAAHAAGAAFVPVPIEWPPGRPYWDAPGGERFESAPWMPGEPLRADDIPPEDSAAAMRALRRFHQTAASAEPPTGGPSPALQERRRRLASLMAPAVDLADRFSGLRPVAMRLAELIARGIDRAKQEVERVADADLPLQPVHGDARPEHFLLTGGVVTGLVDFGAIRVDSPQLDVARLAGELARGDPARRAAIAAAYGPGVDPAVVAALDLSGALLAAANWLCWMAPGGPPAVGADPAGRRLGSLETRISRLLADDLPGSVC